MRQSSHAVACSASTPCLPSPPSLLRHHLTPTSVPCCQRPRRTGHAQAQSRPQQARMARRLSQCRGTKGKVDYKVTTPLHDAAAALAACCGFALCHKYILYLYLYLQLLQKNPTSNALSMKEGWAQRLPTAEIPQIEEKKKNAAEQPAGGGHDGRKRCGGVLRVWACTYTMEVPHPHEACGKYQMPGKSGCRALAAWT